MLKRILICSMCVLICLCFLSFTDLYGQAPTPTKPSNKPQNQTTSSQNQAKIISEAAQSPVAVIPLPVAPNTQIEPSDKTKNENSKSSADWWLVYFTAALVAVVFLQFTWMIRQEKWMRRNVEITKEAADAAKKSADALPAIERAYLFVTIIMKNPDAENIAGTVDEKPQYNTGTVKLIVNNHGKTPAILNAYPYTTEVLTSSEIDEKIAKFSSDDMDTWVPFGPVIINGNTALKEWSTGFFINNKKWRQITTEEAYLACIGCLHYQDIFGKPHKTVFCWKYEQFSGFHYDKDPKRNYRT